LPSQACNGQDDAITLSAQYHMYPFLEIDGIVRWSQPLWPNSNQPSMAPIEGSSFYQKMNPSNANLRVIQLKMKNATNTTYHDNIMVVIESCRSWSISYIIFTMNWDEIGFPCNVFGIVVAVVVVVWKKLFYKKCF